MSEGAVTIQPGVVNLPPAPIRGSGAVTEILSVIPATTYKQQLDGKKVWIDIDNSPHVPFFLPIIEELENRGVEVVLTARDIYQVCELLKFFKLPCKVVG